jgi:hypothetical protein
MKATERLSILRMNEEIANRGELLEGAQGGYEALPGRFTVSSPGLRAFSTIGEEGTTAGSSLRH